MKILTHLLGFPRIGAQRELKKALEAYWKGRLSAESLERTAAEIRHANWQTQKQAGIDLLPSNDFSFYDQVLDTTCLVGNVPTRLRNSAAAAKESALDRMFRIARGRSVENAGAAGCASGNSSGAVATVANSDGTGREAGGEAENCADNRASNETDTHSASAHSCGCGCNRHHDAQTGTAADRTATAAAGNAATDTTASEMTKWFDTNYHYIVPEFDADTSFRLGSTKIFDEFAEALALGIRTKPVLTGPVSYLLLGKSRAASATSAADATGAENTAGSASAAHAPAARAAAATANGIESLEPLSLLPQLLPVYAEVLRRLHELGAEWVQLDEPVLSLDLSAQQQQALTNAYAELGRLRNQGKAPRILLATYFGPLLDNRQTALALDVDAIHVDAVRGREEIPALLDAFPKEKILSLGVVDGRNIWRNDFEDSLALISLAVEKLGGAQGREAGAARLWLAPSCSLLHSPVSLKAETALDAELKGWLAFAEEKLAELATLARAASGDTSEEITRALAQNRAARESRRTSSRIHVPAVKERVAALRPQDSRRATPFAERLRLQHKRLKLPAFATTTIGSFPQSDEVRAARARLRKGEWTQAQYEQFIEAETVRCIRVQEEIGIDVLVHGEFERTDMVEYFGESLAGFAFTRNGWVQSYGSRCVKPPVIFADVSRPAPMTVRWSAFAKAQTSRPMKGMLTGPITILQWSFVRDDQPREQTARQIALAIRDEVADLEQAGIPIIQIDEPAIREGLPLRRDEWEKYLGWATECFRLSASVVTDATQIHTHMCYSEFNDIIAAIAAMDADCISIETARSDMELLRAFETFHYPNHIGPGVWDIHSPRVPPVEEMAALLKKAARVLPAQNLWANPDCGLKTRGWPETIAALKNLVASAAIARRESNDSRNASEQA